MNRILLWAAAILASLVLVLSWAAKSQYDRAQYLKIENKAFSEALERAAVREERDRKVLVARQARVASTARKLAEVEKALNAALNNNPEWRDTSVPADIQEVLKNAH